MTILNSQFEGADGSELENQLERQVVALDAEMAKLKAALNRWNNARFLLIYSCNQIQNAEAKWAMVMAIDSE
jgi:exonuclease VII small subunit